MDRRNIELALTRRGMLAGLAVLAARPSWALPANPDVVVIGAGAAGIGAARRLAELKLSCVVVEAADRNPFYKMAEADGFKLKYHDLTLNELYTMRARADAPALKREHEAEEVIHKRTAAIARRRDIPVSRAVPRWTQPFEAAATYLGPMDMAVDLNNLSTADFAQSADLDPNYLVYEGFGTVVARAGAELPVKLSTPVRKIDWSRKGNVAVETD